MPWMHFLEGIRAGDLPWHTRGDPPPAPPGQQLGRLTWQTKRKETIPLELITSKCLHQKFGLVAKSFFWGGVMSFSGWQKWIMPELHSYRSVTDLVAGVWMINKWYYWQKLRKKKFLLRTPWRHGPGVARMFTCRNVRHSPVTVVPHGESSIAPWLCACSSTHGWWALWANSTDTQNLPKSRPPSDRVTSESANTHLVSSTGSGKDKIVPLSKKGQI